ncbi:hypothetical protein EDD22DRAFT_1047356 [Suillus occidentalis]|nr:hypothetical protein EDD22DRAFT_1047356 [Suillus occidentalis]
MSGLLYVGKTLERRSTLTWRSSGDIRRAKIWRPPKLDGCDPYQIFRCLQTLVARTPSSSPSEAMLAIQPKTDGGIMNRRVIGYGRPLEQEHRVVSFHGKGNHLRREIGGLIDTSLPPRVLVKTTACSGHLLRRVPMFLFVMNFWGSFVDPNKTSRLSAPSTLIRLAVPNDRVNGRSWYAAPRWRDSINIQALALTDHVKSCHVTQRRRESRRWSLALGAKSVLFATASGSARTESEHAGKHEPEGPWI